MNLIICCVHLVFFYIMIHFFNVLYIDCDMIDRTIGKLCLLIFIRFNYQGFQLQECNLFPCLFIDRPKCNFESKILIKLYRFFNIICRNSDMLDSCCICLQIHLIFPSFLLPWQAPALPVSRLSFPHRDSRLHFRISHNPSILPS